MKRIALTGGIACGKSLVAKFLNELGVETLDADDIVHALLPDPAERRRLAAAVFADPEKRRALEAKIHPLVEERMESWLLSRPQGALAIVIVPLLFEVHWNEKFDIICAVISERDCQVSRMMTTRGYSREEAEARLAAQLPVAEKAAQSHYVIENNGSEAELKAKVVQLVNTLRNG